MNLISLNLDESLSQNFSFPPFCFSWQNSMKAFSNAMHKEEKLFSFKISPDSVFEHIAICSAPTEVTVGDCFLDEMLIESLQQHWGTAADCMLHVLQSIQKCHI